jgi:hypothetical protein
MVARQLRGAARGEVALTPARADKVDGRDIFVFDEVLPAEEIGRYFRAMTQASFTRSETARSDSNEFRHWVCEMPLANLARTSLWPPTEAAVRGVRPEERFAPYRVYTNFASFGDTLLTHVDALPELRELTALWFLCESWDKEWGGETLFYDAGGDAQIAVAPRAGRLLLFDGAIRHAGKPPNRNCPIGRYTFAIKLRVV